MSFMVDHGLIRRYVDRIANAKWEVKELGMEHNGYFILSFCLTSLFINIQINGLFELQVC